MICRLNNLSWRRLLRWIILVSLVIYVSLLIVWYRKNFPLRGMASDPSDDDGMNMEDPAIENLFLELETATIGKKDRDLYENVALGRENEESMRGELEERKNRENSRNLLEDIFHRADVDEDQLLDIQEIAKWIHAKISEHVRRAMRDNVGLFTAIDNNPRNGEVSWEEYHAHFLRLHGFSESYVQSHDKRHKEMTRTMKENIMRDRARWTDAARNDPDKLTLDEFLAFTHPESSHRALLQMVEDLFEKFDRDGDEELTEDEFSGLPAEGIGLELDENRHQTLGGSAGRRKEFRHLIDKNKNGKADRTELLMYIDPRNPRHAIQEAQHLITLSDIDLDEKLDLWEVLGKMDLFLCSKMVDTEKSFHDEF